MEHPAELKVYSFFQRAVAGKTSFSEEVADKVASDVKAALLKQFDSGPRDEFRLRMSNIGRPKCQLWFDKNDPADNTPFPPHFMMNMMLGDIVEAVFKGILNEAGVDFQDNEKVTLELANGRKINGEYDMIMDGKLDDVKSASPWSYTNKFASFDSLADGDGFGYVSQLVGYAEAAGVDVGGWWVVNKGNGEFKYVDASVVDREKVLADIQATVDFIDNDEPFERCFEPIKETFYRKETGNWVLPSGCKFCSFKHKCHTNLTPRPSIMSKAKNPPEVDYTFVAEEYN
jgi:hypothetical protein